jgi:hypothetical protein
VEDGPLLGAHSAPRAFALHLKWCVPAITPDVPFCSAGKVAPAVVLERRSAPEPLRPAAPTTSAAERDPACCSAGAGVLPRLLLLQRPYLNQARQSYTTAPPQARVMGLPQLRVGS